MFWIWTTCLEYTFLCCWLPFTMVLWPIWTHIRPKIKYFFFFIHQDCFNSHMGLLQPYHLLKMPAACLKHELCKPFIFFIIYRTHLNLHYQMGIKTCNYAHLFLGRGTKIVLIVTWDFYRHIIYFKCLLHFFIFYLTCVNVHYQREIKKTCNNAHLFLGRVQRLF